MKILSIAVPCYNSQDYMEKCVNSLLPGGDDVEILVVNDGSKDDTAKIADRLEAEHPGIVRAIHQENAGHGGAVTTGIKNATGLFFKVVDSDDCVDLDAYMKILAFLKKAVNEGRTPDMLLSNYIYDKVGAKNKKVMHYRRYFPTEQYFTWDDVKPLPFNTVILMHSVIYKMDVLRECNLELPKKTFYVDNLYVVQPMPFIHSIYYLDVDFYKYFIGRDDQSVNETVMISRLDQQHKITRIMIDSVMESKDLLMNKTLCTNVVNYLNMMMTVSSILALISNTPEHIQMKKELWQYLKNSNEKLYRHLRYRTPLGIAMNLPGEAGRQLAIKGYKIANKIYGFN